MSNGDIVVLTDEEKELDDEFDEEATLEDEERKSLDSLEGEEEDENEEPELEDLPLRTAKQEVVLRVEQPETAGKRKSRRRTKTMEEIGYEEIDRLVQELDPGATTRNYITITRVDPKVWKGRKIEGYLEKIERHIDIQELKDLYGGGTYDIRFLGPRKFKDGSIKGNKIFTSRRIVIAGDPVLTSHKMDDEENNRQSSTHDPDIVKQALNSQDKMMERQDVKNREEKETLLALISGNKGGGEETMGVFTKMMEVSEKRAEAALKTAEAQISAIREEARMAREEAQRKEDRHREEVREIRKEMDEKKASSGDTMIQFMREQSKENMQRMELTMKSVSDTSKNMMDMMSGNHKMQSELLVNELKRVSDELKDSRLSNKGDLVSEMKKVATLQGFIKDIAGTNQEEKSLTDKITDNLPEIMEQIPGIFAGLGGLFRGGRPVQQQVRAPVVPQRMLQAPPRPLPPRRPSSFPSGREVPEEDVPVPFQQQPVRVHPEPQALSLDQEQQMNIAQEIAKLKVSFEEALIKGESAEACYKAHIEGQYDEELLRKIAVMPTPAIITVLQNQLDDDSPLFTVKGKDFLRHVHNAIKEKFV